MSIGHACWVVSFVILGLLGLGVDISSEDIDFTLIGLSLIPLGLALSGWIVPLFPHKP